MRLLRRANGQSLMEYALLIMLAAAALVATFGFIRSALSHRLKDGADGIGQGLVYQGE